MNLIETIANENETKFKQLEEKFNEYRSLLKITLVII